MKEPDEEKVKELLHSVHCEGLPHWTTEQQLEAYKQLDSLYYHWFRLESTASKPIH